MLSFFDFVCLLDCLFWHQPQPYRLLVFEVRTLSSIYNQLSPMDPYAFYNVPAMSMQKILQFMSRLDINCCFDSFMADLSVCNCVV